MLSPEHAGPFLRRVLFILSYGLRVLRSLPPGGAVGSGSSSRLIPILSAGPSSAVLPLAFRNFLSLSPGLLS